MSHARQVEQRSVRLAADSGHRTVTQAAWWFAGVLIGATLVIELLLAAMVVIQLSGERGILADLAYRLSGVVQMPLTGYSTDSLTPRAVFESGTVMAMVVLRIDCRRHPAVDFLVRVLDWHRVAAVSRMVASRSLLAIGQAIVWTLACVIEFVAWVTVILVAGTCRSIAYLRSIDWECHARGTSASIARTAADVRVSLTNRRQRTRPLLVLQGRRLAMANEKAGEKVLIKLDAWLRGFRAME